MAEVFISYSRKDKEFVRRLGDALVAHQREAWVDWKDIPLTAEWQQEIFSNIEAADNFIFIISPDSVASANCKKEIDHAVANNKRIVPIFYRAVSDGDIPETLGRFQRIDFDDDNGFEANFAVLIMALDTDLAWTQAHTRLLTRAKEWERQGKDRSFLLRGKDLGEAEQMVAKTAGREPKPTTLQSQYILASRQSATKTQRIIIGGILTALVVSIGLAIYAFIQKNLAQDETRIADKNAAEAKQQKKSADDNAAEATRQKETAQKNEAEAKRQQGIAEDETAKAVLQSRITNARRLATESLYRFGYSAADLAISGALAVESLQAYPTTDGMKALLQVLRLIPAPPRILANVHNGEVGALAFSRDGRWMASAGGDGQVLLWNLSDQLNRRSLEHQLPFYSPAGAMDFSPEGRWLAAACAQGGSNAAVCIWDTSTGKPAQSPLSHAYILHSIAFAPDGQHLATSTFGTGRGIRLFRWAAQRWEEAQTIPPGGGAYVGVAFAKNGVLAVADDSGVWLTQPGSSPSVATYKFAEAGPCFALSFSVRADVQTLAALCREGVVIGPYSQNAYNLKLAKVPIHTTSLTRMSLAPNGDFVAIDNIVFSAGDGDARILLAARDSAVSTIGYPPAGNVVIGGLKDGSIALWPTTQGNFAIRLSDRPSMVTGVSVSPDERVLAVVTEDGALLFYDISNYRRIRRLRMQNVGVDPKPVLFSPNGRFIAITANHSIRLLTAANLGTVASKEVSGELQTAFTFDSRELVTLGSSGIYRIDTGNGKQVGPVITGRFQKFTLSPDSQWLATYSEYNVGGQHHYIRSRRVWKLSNGVEVAWEEEGREPSDGPATRPSQGGPQRLVKAAAGWSTPAELRSLSPDSLWRVELNRYSATLVLKEAEANRPIASLEHDGAVIDAAFSPKGRWLVSSSEDGTVRLWPMKNDELTTQACRMLPRNLTPAEWKEFRMDGPYRKTCPTLP